MMTDFELDSRLANDCIVLGELNSCILLLMDNVLVPWFILVPKTTEVEIIDLTPAEQTELQDAINIIGLFVKNNFSVSKLNIAAIGNIVSQLHIHIVGRDPSDFCWPNVVWGRSERERYTQQKITEVSNALKQQLGSQLTLLVNDIRKD